jgi:hypothetical protein
LGAQCITPTMLITQLFCHWKFHQIWDQLSIESLCDEKKFTKIMSKQFECPIHYSHHIDHTIVLCHQKFPSNMKSNVNRIIVWCQNFHNNNVLTLRSSIHHSHHVDHVIISCHQIPFKHSPKNCNISIPNNAPTL